MIPSLIPEIHLPYNMCYVRWFYWILGTHVGEYERLYVLKCCAVYSVKESNPFLMFDSFLVHSSIEKMEVICYYDAWFGFYRNTRRNILEERTFDKEYISYIFLMHDIQT